VIPLTFSVVFAVGFGHVMKWATHVRANLLWVAAVNYVVAALLCLVAMAVVRPGDHALFAALTGIWGGVCYLLSLLYYFAAVNRIGMGLATSANRIAVAVPVAVALVVWHESLRPVQSIGLVFVAVAFPLLGSGRDGFGKTEIRVLAGTLVPLFVVTGAGQLSNRIFSSGAPAQNTFLFLACLFGAAATTAFVALAIQPVSLKRQDVGIGLTLGGVNLMTNLFLLAALRELPSSVVFSVSSAASVMLAAITGVIFWRERLNLWAATGVGLATLAVVLLTL
jgi:drug/metabolite transporter (DMT)-like permease